MRYILFIMMLIGGLLSFNSYAKGSCPALQVPFQFDLFLSHYVSFHPSDPKSEQLPALDIHSCTYVLTSFSCPANADRSHSGSFCTATSAVLLSDDGDTDSPLIDSDKDKPDTKPDIPDVKPSEPDIKPPQPDVNPPEPDKPTPPSGSYLSQVLSDISLLTPAMLYSSFSFHYDFSSSLEDNKRVAQAFLQKLSNVTPPDYASVNRIRDMMDDWQKTYSYLRPSDAGPYYLWNATKFVGGEHRYRGEIVLPVDTCERPVTNGGIGDDGLPVYHMEVFHNCSDKFIQIDIPDPNYASLNDYKNGITRCMRNPNDPSCRSSGDSSGDHTVTTCNPGYHPDASRPGVCVSDNSGGVPGDGEKPDNCPPPSYHKPGTMEGSCTTDLNPNPGDDSSSTVSSGGVPVIPGNGHSTSGDGDNGDVVAAINSLHADVNENHKETMDTITDLPQETPDLIEGYLSPKLNSIIDGMKKEMTDDYNDALAEFKGVFGDIDSYVPDIKLSFDLPVQFTSGIRGRCVPLVFDFNITLVGFQPYHFHAEGVQACQLYDTYIRSIVEYMLYFLTALACRRVFTRAAEYVTSQS
ncbi:hypothetical protein C9H16_24420 [Salmonella enterica]|nr:hypothetical protein [Salmonella enterica]